MRAKKETRGGARKGAGRKPSGRVTYVTRMTRERIAWIKSQAEMRACEQCVIVEEAVDLKMKRTKG